MKIDTRELENGSLIETDVVIVGGGIAGLTLANELTRQGHEVAVLESGREEPDERTQALYEGEATLEGPGAVVRYQDGYMDTSRFRYYGGSGNRWGGVCVPLDPVDFEARDWVANSGWPITLAQLKPYYNRACDQLELPHFYPELGAGPRFDPPLNINGEQRLVSRPHYLTRHTGRIPGGPFQSWKDETAKRKRLRLYLGANVSHIHLDSTGKGVDSLRVRTLEGREHKAQGKSYVLATGGIENVRLLLASRDVHEDGIGNHSDWLGRCFQGHALIVNRLSQFMTLLSGPNMIYYTKRRRDRVSYVVGTTAAAQREIRGGNFSVYLKEGPPAPSNTQSIHSLASRLSPPGTPRMELMSAFFGIEHTPNRDSRITLLPDERDELGMPRVKLRWKHSQFDLDSFERAVDQVVK